MSDHYILDDDYNVVQCPDLLTWARWFESRDRRIVGKTNVNGYHVSTVFLGLNHRFGDPKLPPILFETMVFKGDSMQDRYCDRYCTHAEAVEGHEIVVAALKAGTLEMY